MMPHLRGQEVHQLKKTRSLAPHRTGPYQLLGVGSPTQPMLGESWCGPVLLGVLQQPGLLSWGCLPNGALLMGCLARPGLSTAPTLSPSLGKAPPTDD